MSFPFLRHSASIFISLGWTGEALHGGQGHPVPLAGCGWRLWLYAKDKQRARCSMHRVLFYGNLEYFANTQHLCLSTVTFSKELNTLTDMISFILSSPQRQGGDQHDCLL